jgi:hypothetical protein
VEWLMGWPEGWTLPYARIGSEPVETVLSQPRPRTPGEDSGRPCSTNEEAPHAEREDPER